MERELEPEVMDTAGESDAYDAMDHSAANAAFVDRLVELAATGRMLDIGTGPGHVPPLVCDRIADAHVVGIDLARTMLVHARRRAQSSAFASRIEYRHADGKRLDFPNASFDVVFSNTVLHHIPEPVQLLREARRVLRPGGALLIRDLFRPETPERARELVRLHATNETSEQQELLRASLHASLTPDELRTAADAAGFGNAELVVDSDRHMSLQQTAARASAGLYAPDSMMWQVNREAVLLLAGPRALLMQLAHPLVAAGVAAHSDFQSDPLRRLRRTLDAMLGIIYGDLAHARECAERVNRVHESVSGTLPTGTAAIPAGTPYTAFDPALLFWVNATLIDSALTAYECFVRPLDVSERETMYQESKRMAPLLRLPASTLPASFEDFRSAITDLIEGPLLEPTPEARALADSVLHPAVPLLPRALADVGSVVTLALLPATLRERYGFVWDRKRELAWRAARELVRRTLPLLPGFARTLPQARRAERTRSDS